MRRLSISTAWDETKAILARDGRLFVSVALAMVAFPTLISGLVNPEGLGASRAPLWVTLLSLVASLIALAGQLALIRLALGPSITVAAAITHGLRRMPIYFLVAVLVVIAFVIIAIPFVAVLVGLGVPVTRTTELPTSPLLSVAMLLYVVVVTLLGVRMTMTAPITSAETIGPIAIIRRSWELTSGNFWRLFGFLIAYFIAAGVVVLGIRATIGSLIGLALGPIEPMSVSALLVALLGALLNAALTAVLALMLARIYVQLAGRGHTDTGVPITGM